MDMFLIEDLKKAEKKKADWPLIELNQTLKDIYTCAATNKNNRIIIENWIKNKIAQSLRAWIEVRSKKSIDEILQESIRKKWFYVIRFYLDTGFNIDEKFMCDRSLLHIAAFHNASQIVRLLLFRGANKDLQDNRGYTPLHETIWLNAEDAASILVKFGADPHIRHKQKRNPLQEIVYRLDRPLGIINGYNVLLLSEPTAVFKLLQRYEKENG